MSSSSDSESDSESTSTRLGDCEVCASNQAKYTCPKCEVKTCSLKCVVIHKKELDCDGLRDRTKFIRVKDFTDTDLLSDYRLLEECARFVYGVKRDEKKKFTRIDKDLPIHLYKLKMAARKRGTVLQFLAQNFTRHSINTTRYHYKNNIISWRLEWVFPNAEPDPVKFVDEKVPEQTKLSDVLDKYLNANSVPFEGSKSLAYYWSVGHSGVKVLLRAEKVRGSAKKFFELDPTESLAENLTGKCVVEFPIIFVVLKDHAYNFEIITTEEEIENDKEQLLKTKTLVNGNTDECIPKLDRDSKSQIDIDRQKPFESRTFHNRKRPLLTEKIVQEKKRQLEKEMKADRKRKPKNLLFTTGYSSEESLGESESDNEKETVGCHYSRAKRQTVVGALPSVGGGP